jgi:ATP-binding cassette subfamily F protein 3
MIVWQRPNLLLLDEPTNHLDLETREALTVALAQFEGTLVLVSHDRHLLRASTDQFLIVADGRLEPFDGDLEDYRDWLFKTKLGATDSAESSAGAPLEEALAPPENKPSAAKTPRTKNEVQTKSVSPATPVDRRDQKRKEAAERQRLSSARKPIESRIKRVEEQMAKLNARKSALESQLVDPAVHDDGSKDALKTLILDQAYVERELSQFEAEWLALQEQLEQLAAAT